MPSVLKVCLRASEQERTCTIGVRVFLNAYCTTVHEKTLQGADGRYAAV